MAIYVSCRPKVIVCQPQLVQQERKNLLRRRLQSLVSVLYYVQYFFYTRSLFCVIKQIVALVLPQVRHALYVTNIFSKDYCHTLVLRAQFTVLAAIFLGHSEKIFVLYNLLQSNILFLQIRYSQNHNQKAKWLDSSKKN